VAFGLIRQNMKKEEHMLDLLMVVVGTCLFMVAGLVVCIGISIFCDSINIGGSFDGIAANVIAIVFIPILAIGRAVDVILYQFVPADIKYSMNSKV
jgi:hypothetical protein